jgi:hypothetical protein
VVSGLGILRGTAGRVLPAIAPPSARALFLLTSGNLSQIGRKSFSYKRWQLSKT